MPIFDRSASRSRGRGRDDRRRSRSRGRDDRRRSRSKGRDERSRGYEEKSRDDRSRGYDDRDRDRSRGGDERNGGRDDRSRGGDDRKGGRDRRQSRSRSQGRGMRDPPRRSRSGSASPPPRSSVVKTAVEDVRWGAVQIIDAKDAEPETAVEEGPKRANGDPTWQGLIKLHGLGGRMRTLRGPSRPVEAEADKDARDMMDAFKSGGMTKLRELQKKQRGERFGSNGYR